MESARRGHRADERKTDGDRESVARMVVEASVEARVRVAWVCTCVGVSQSEGRREGGKI